MPTKVGLEITPHNFQERKKIMKVKELIKTLKELEPNVEINFDVIDVLNNENRVEFIIQDEGKEIK